MATTQSKYGRRFDEEFKREVAALASKPGAKQEQVARDLGVSAYSVSRWKQQYSPASAASSAPGVSVAELERRIRSLERENADLREQRTILSLNRSTGFLRFAAIKLFLAGLHLCHELTHPHRRQRLLLAGTEFREPLGRRQCLSGIDLV